jgi:hypothetical protein
MGQLDHAAVLAYRFYFLDESGHIANTHEIESASDEEAGELAALMLAEQSKYPGIEVWDRARKVCRIP